MKKLPFILFMVLLISTGLAAQEKPACPTLSVWGPATVPKAGDVITFTATVNGADTSAKLKYNWSISAGEILEGQGTAAIKMKSNTSPTVTVEVEGFPASCENVASDSSCGLGPPQAVLVDEIGDGCPKVTVETSPVAVIDGYPMTFTAKVSGAGKRKLVYKWTVSNGEITEGQGTPEIRVETLGFAGEEIKATLTVRGLPKRCKTRASVTGFVKVKPYLN